MPAQSPTAGLSRIARFAIVAAAFLGWFFAGVPMALTPLASPSAAKDFLRRLPEDKAGGGFDTASLAAGFYPGKERDSALGTSLPPEREKFVGVWFARYNVAFLLGAAAGGLVFGWIGDRFGRTKALGLSVVCYTLFSGISYYAGSAEQLLILRFVTCMGIGGTWPNGIALASEAWPGVSRPLLAGIIGTAANVGQVAVGLLATQVVVTPDDWRWVMLLAAAPLPLGLLILWAVPESPRWLAARDAPRSETRQSSLREILQPPLLWATLLGIALGTIPLLGGWGSGNWLVPWADKVAGSADQASKAWTSVARSLGGSISSLLGGMVASRLGRRPSYFLISLGSLAVSAVIFHGTTPPKKGEPSLVDLLTGLIGFTDPVALADVNWFTFWAFMVGVVAGFYFGWLPLCLPELFPTRVRSTGAGVTFNFGRIASAAGVMGAGYLTTKFNGDYGRVGAWTSLIYAVGMIVIWFAPAKPRSDLDEKSPG